MNKKKNIKKKFENESKIDFPLNNTISCYHRPHLNYNISTKNKIKNKKTNFKIKFKNKKIRQFLPKIDSCLITFPKINTSFDNQIINKENINTNSNSNINSNSKTIDNFSKNKYFTPNKLSNNSKYKKNNYFKLLKYNKKSSISKDIAILCKIINSNTNSENKIKKYNKKIIVNTERRIIYKKERQIIKIQNWWRNKLYKLYIEKYILLIQKSFRKYLARKKYFNDNRKKFNIGHVIFIQKSWKKYMLNKCLNNYYFFSFKKYMKPKKDNNIKKVSIFTLSKSNINIKKENNIKINNLISFKNNQKNYYITKSYFKLNLINNIIEKIKKIQVRIKHYLYEKNNLNKNLLKSLPIRDICHITKEKKYHKLIVNNEIIFKIKKIQKNFKNFLSLKNEDINNITFNIYNSGFIVINPEIENNDKLLNTNIIRKIFISYITYKLSKFFILILNRMNMIHFIKMLHQRIQKNINQFIFINLINLKTKNKIIQYNSHSYFFQTIWRHIKININLNNEVALLLKNNIPKYFKKDFSKLYIPYINYSQENNLIKTQLFMNNNVELVNYIFYFIEKEKDINININKKYIKYHLNKYNLSNKNIFYITKYIDILRKDLINKKLNIIKKNINESNIISHKVNFEKYNYNNTEEKNYIKENGQKKELYDDKINSETTNDSNINHNNSNCYNIKNFNCKFIDYLNKK